MVMSRLSPGEIVSIQALRKLSFCQGTTEAPAHIREQFSIVFYFGGVYGYNIPAL